jgi:glycerol-3-phosphate O-acyltransferase
MHMPSLSLAPPSEALIFRFNEHRAGIVGEVASRSVAARREAAADRPDQAVEYVLNDLVMHERPRLRVVRPPDVEEDRDRVEKIARALGRRAGEDEFHALLEAQVRAYAEDIAGWFSVPAYHLARQVLRGALSLLLVPQSLRSPIGLFQELESRVLVEGDATPLRDLAQKGVLILVPTHVSNLDSILVGFALDRYGLPPMCYGGGKNLFTNPVSSWFMTHLGAYKVDRRLRFHLYKEVLKTYSQVLLERGFHSIFFPGGTRSRSGAVEQKLKLGLAGTVLSAYVNTLRRAGPAAKRYFFVPITINLPLTLEAETLVEDHLKEIGKNRYIIDDDEFSRLERIVAFTRKLLTMEQAVEVWVGPPRTLPARPMGSSYRGSVDWPDAKPLLPARHPEWRPGDRHDDPAANKSRACGPILM